MRAIISAATVATMLLGTAPVFAKEMHCNVNQDFKAALDGKEFKNDGTTYKLKVKDTFKGLPDNVNSKDYNKYVNIKFGTEKTTSKSLNVQVRPRKSSECLNAIFNEKQKQIWGGAYCDTSKHKKASSVTLSATADNPALFMTGGAARTTSKVNQFMAFYRKQGSDYLLTGVCVEDK
jgi:hypothetical protein